MRYTIQRMHPEASLRLLDANQPPSSGAQTLRRARSLRDHNGQRALVCAECRAHISDSSKRIEVAGQHEHTFFNPEGVVYRIACFAAAPGCSGVGPFFSTFSWFPGHRWQVAICASCAAHLGWHFQGESTFSALIVERIHEHD